MKQTVNIGIIGEFDAKKASHPAINDSIRHAAKHLGIDAKVTWVATTSLLNKAGQKAFAGFDGLWASSGSPYASTAGMLKGIQFARESGKPFVGT